MKEYLFHFFFIIYSFLIYKYRNKISTTFGLMDFPDNIRKSHSEPTPAVGGLILFPYVLSALIYLNFLSYIKLKILLIYIFIYFSFFLIGFFDDKIHLNAKSKTFILLFILFIVLPLEKSLIISVLNFKDINYLILLNQGSLFFTIFCIFFFYNALNFSDGLNGIVVSLCLYFIVVLVLARNEFNVLYLSLIISLTFLLITNLFKKIFTGNSGVNFLSAIIFLLIIDTYNKNIIFFDEVILIVFLPSIDAARITIERIINGNSPFISDKNHFHHLLTNFFNKNYVFIPYSLLAMTPYLVTKIGISSYNSLIIFSVIYFLSLFFLKKKNV